MASAEKNLRTDSVGVYRRYNQGIHDTAHIVSMTSSDVFMAEIAANYPPISDLAQKDLFASLRSKEQVVSEEAAFVLFMSAIPLIMQKIAKKSRDGIAVEDVLQETSMILLPKIPRFDPSRATFEQFINGLLPNAIRYAKERIEGRDYYVHSDGTSKHPITFSDIPRDPNGHVIESIDSSLIPLDELLIRKETARTVRAKISTLDPLNRQVLVLYYGIQSNDNPDGSHYSYKEIAEMLNVSIATVKNRIHRSKIALQKLPEIQMLQESE